MLSLTPNRVAVMVELPLPTTVRVQVVPLGVTVMMLSSLLVHSIYCERSVVVAG